MLTEKIKVIKHAERNDSQAVGLDERRTGVRDHLGETKRDAVTIVTGWVNEFRRKKSEEATNGFDKLFGDAR